MNSIGRMPHSYQGVALTAPVSFGYAKQDNTRTAVWYIGNVLRELLNSANLAKEELDGFAVSSFSLGAESAITLTQHFDISPRWIDQLPYGGCSGVIAMRRAARAIQCGDASVIACIGGDASGYRSFETMSAEFSNFSMDAAFPYGAAGPNLPFSLITQYYMDKFGVSREDFGRIAVAQRYNANHYDDALFSLKTLSMKQYLEARPIAGPLHLFDCVMPCAGGEGFLMMSVERAQELNLPYCEILSAAELHNAYSIDEVQYKGGWTNYADALFTAAGIGRQDVDFVQTYDDYPVISLMQLEDLGFCNKGDGAEFLQNIDFRFDGSGASSRKLPHNTSGGQLSVGQAGSAAGYMGVVESIRQLTNSANNNQVADAKIGLVSGYGMINYDRGLCSGAAILSAAGRHEQSLGGT